MLEAARIAAPAETGYDSCKIEGENILLDIANKEGERKKDCQEES